MGLNIIRAFNEIASEERLIKDLGDAIKNDLFYEDAKTFFRIQPGIKGGQQVVALEPLEYVTKKDEGCGGGAEGFKINGVTQKWEPTLAKVNIKMCYSEFMDSFTRWGLANGYAIHDLGESDVYPFIQDQVIHAMKADFTRLALFGDENIASQEILADTNKAKYYDVVKMGLIPTLQYFKTMEEFKGNFVSIDANSKATRAEQMALGELAALNIFEALTDDQYFDSDQILTSASLFKNYKNFLRRGSGVTPLESSKEQIQKGMESLMFDGEALTQIKFHDKKRLEDFTKDGKTHLPHFAVNTSKDNLVIGVDDVNSLTDLHLEYIGGEDEHFYIKGNYQVDFKIPNPMALRAAF